MADNTKRGAIARIGFWLALAPWCVLPLTSVCGAVGVPGFG